MLPGYFNSDRLRCTGAPVVCANVLEWAPSRVTRRGALAATAAAAAAAAFPPSPRHLPSPPVSPYTHARPLLPLGPQSPWSRGPLGTPTSPPWGPMVAWQAAFSLLHKIHLRCSVYSRTAQRTIPSLTALPPVCSLSLFFPWLQVRRLCHATTFFLLFRLLASDRDAHASIGIQYRSFRNLSHIFILLFSSNFAL